MKPITLVTAALLALLALSGAALAADAPLADAGLDQTVSVDTTVHLDGTGSVHPDGTIETYTWTIRTPGGRVVTPECPDCSRTQFTPLVPGQYEATVTVTGTDGTTASDTLHVYVNDAGPSVDLTGDRTPDPSEPVDYTASAESPDAELEEIAWAVEDQIVAVRSLDGSTDASELSLAFTDTETHRIQVVVKDTNGRTAYDQLNVKPQDGSENPPPSWSDVDPEIPEPGCGDSGGCEVKATPEETPEGEVIPGPKQEHIVYETDGFGASFGLGSRIKDSSSLGSKIEEFGIDGGNNAYWRKNALDLIVDGQVKRVSTAFFGQERETIDCELTPGTVNTCSHTAYSLEQRGESSNVRSPSNGGAYSAYGLQNAERVRGGDPRKLKEGQSAEVTIVVQQEKEGIVDKVVDAAKDGTRAASATASSHVRLSSNSVASSGHSGRNSDRTERSGNSVTTRKSQSGITAGSGASPEQPVSDSSSSGGSSSTGNPSSIAHIPTHAKRLLKG